MTPTTALRVFVPFAAGYFLSYLFRAVNAVLARPLATDVGVGPGALGLLTAAYLIAFAAAQLPLGVLLDRYGPRRIEALLLLFAAAGAMVFSRAESLAGLVVGRALIGFGVSACLMAAFKAYVLWFPPERWPLVNGLQMAAGGLGALSATRPVQALLAVTDWRGVFGLLAALTLAAAFAVWTVVPARRPVGGTRLAEQLAGVRAVFASPVFWRISPWTVASQAALMAIQGLWAGPWLRDVAGLDADAAARVLMWTAAGMVTGFLSLGFLAERLGRRGVPPAAVATGGMAAFMAVQLIMVLGVTAAVRPLWFAFGLCGTAGIVSYADLSQRFPAELSGRVNTGLNLLVFVAAFAGQWGIGEAISLYPPAGAGYAPAGYRAGFGLMLALQAAGAVWYLVAGRRRER